MTTITKIPFRTIITVQEGERALVLKNGRFLDILRPGRHTYHGSNRFHADVFDLMRAEFSGPLEKPLYRERADLAEEHFTEVRTGPDEVALIVRDGKLYGVQRPDGRSVFWSDAGPWEIERIDVSESLDVASEHAIRLERLSQTDKVKKFSVAEGQQGLLTIDNEFVRTLDPGVYMFWNVGRPVAVKLVDVRRNALEVSGQEILTKDRVSIRVNLAVEYQVTDAVKAVSEVDDFGQAIYRAVQFAFRKSLGTKTLDQILGQKAEVDQEVSDKVTAEMAQIGIRIGDISVKDVILPGDMREILNRVVLAEKEAEANVIRRREETAATRSLLNTAKVMAENPVMLRLKEMEALEKVAEKVQYLAVHNGTQGLLDDLVSLREKS